ncbi:MAG: carboxylate--amine ligase [Dehalococcoidia bacterium]
MKRIMVTGAGGAPSIGLTRSLKAATAPYRVIGIDADKYNIHRAISDEKYLVPKAREADYLPVLKSVIKETQPDLLCVQQSAEMLTISAARDELGVKTFLPRHRTLEICEDKFLSQQVWVKAGLPVPATVLVNNEADLKQAFDDLGRNLWIRATTGSAGRDALPVDNFETARDWIQGKNGWGRFTAAERLRPQSVTWQSIWKDGCLLVAQGRKRLYWEFSNRAPSGVTGVTGTGVTVSDPVVDEIARDAVLAIDQDPDGIFGVDLTYDEEGLPNLTEINCGRFFTTHQFFTNAGLNLPDIFVRAALGEELPTLPGKVNPLPEGLVWIRGMDVEPVLTDLDNVASLETELEQRRGDLQ